MPHTQDLGVGWGGWSGMRVSGGMVRVRVRGDRWGVVLAHQPFIIPSPSRLYVSDVFGHLHSESVCHATLEGGLATGGGEG